MGNCMPSSKPWKANDGDTFGKRDEDAFLQVLKHHS